MKETCQTPRTKSRSSIETLISFDTVGKSRWLTESFGKFGLADCILFSFQHQHRAWRTFPPPGKRASSRTRLPHPLAHRASRGVAVPSQLHDSTMELAPAHAHSKRAISLFLPRCCPPAPARRSPPAARDPEEVAVRADNGTPGAQPRTTRGVGAKRLCRPASISLPSS